MRSIRARQAYSLLLVSFISIVYKSAQFTYYPVDMKRIACSVAVILLTFVICGNVFSQEESETADYSVGASPVLTAEAQQKVMLAQADPDYPITPGDVFRLSYVSSLGKQSLTLTVESDYSLNMGVFGKIDTRNLVLSQLTERIESSVTRAYPGSYPNAVLARTGSFKVFVTGEVNSSYNATAWGLTRLSEIVKGRLTPYSSLRDVKVTGRNGGSRVYDLFQASRYGDLTEDPYLKPGDVISLSKAERTVNVQGRVRRPGEYQLLHGENLRDLLEMYADGFPPGADTERITIQRRAEDESIFEVFEIDSTVTNLATVQLKDTDTVSIPDRTAKLPVVYFEGAVIPEDESVTTPSGRIRYTLKTGDTMFRALKSIEESIAPTADLAASVIIKPGRTEQIPVNLERLLHKSPGVDDFELVPGDRIVIPYGIHEVFVGGEVKSAGWFKARPLSRLSEIVAERLTEYSSDRDIAITSADGETVYFDLFRARRYGEQDEDPYLSPGDVITVSRLERQVRIEGEVERPGQYQLLTGETLANLVNFYGSGFTKMADPEEVELVRYDTANDSIAETVYLDCTDSAWRDFQLRDLDRIIVPPETRKLPFVLFEGAVYRMRSTEEGTTLEASNRLQYTFEKGELMSTAVHKLEASFTEVSDLKNSYIIHADGQTTPIDLELLLFRQPDAKDVELKPLDRVIIPFRQFFVIVSGAVLNPGRYPYIPDRSFSYYIDLAGGFDPERHAGDAVTIIDIDNNVLSADDPIGPETKIVAPNNNPLYAFSRISGILGTIISVTTLVITLLR